MFTKIETLLVTLVTLAFLSFFFIYLLFLLKVINKPFKVGQERGDDDVSLFLLYEFVVHARYAKADLEGEQGHCGMVEELETPSEDVAEAAAAAAEAEAVDEVSEDDLREEKG